MWMEPWRSPKEAISSQPLLRLFSGPFQGSDILLHRLSPCLVSLTAPPPQYPDKATSRTNLHQMLLRPHILTCGWWKSPPSHNGNWWPLVLMPLPVRKNGAISVEWCNDFSWSTGFELEVTGLVWGYLVFTLPVLIILFLFLIHVSPGERSVNMRGCCFQQIHSVVNAKPGFASKPVWQWQQEQEIGLQFL